MEKAQQVESSVDKLAASIDRITEKLSVAEKSLAQDIQKEFLNALYELRESLKEELDHIKVDVAAQGQQGGATDLQEENNRLNYRVKILSDNLKEEMNNRKTAEDELRKENERLRSVSYTHLTLPTIYSV
eukprot:TRINITY_DN1536_c0_g1_i4.p1 TRINITY_DN1536_c0_g1~~TRINITY_DN1536_c0_g1_i4.p1  ORF type:complete len:130 (-),score=50.82 TRINITY_DN1536_c0_g1_i4:36-425(-)